MINDLEIGFVVQGSEAIQLPAAKIEADREFDKAAKIGVYKELHSRRLISDYELELLIKNQVKAN